MIQYEQIFNTSYRVPYNLQYFAEGGADKTEEATGKKLTDARGEGQVAKSTELITASGLATLFIILRLFSGYMGKQFIDAYTTSFSRIDTLFNTEFSISLAGSLLSDAIISIIMTCLPIFLFAMFVSFGVLLFQVKWKISLKIIQPKFSKINPVNGFKKILSQEKLVSLFVEIIKIAVISYVAYSTLKNDWQSLLTLYDMGLIQAIEFIGNLVINLGLKISIIFIVIGFGDLIYQKMKFKKDMRMTKQEVKDEFKNSDGDPQLKGKIKQKMREISMKRMMQDLPKADVVITNPTHLAAAIKYDKEKGEAPVLIAKGADFLAQRIKDIARENNIEIVENKPLARMLYYNVEVGSEVPPELYQMTAEVLAYVYGLKNKAN